MDTSFLYHAFGLEGLKCTSTEYKGNAIILNVEYSKRKIKCPCCGKRTLVKNGCRHRNSLTRQHEIKPLYEVASSHMARRAFVGGLYHKVQDPNAIGSMTGHAEGSKAFARYRKVELELKKSLTDMLD